MHLKDTFCLALFFNLDVKLLNGIPTSKEKHVTLLLIGTTLGRVLAAPCDQGLAGCTGRKCCIWLMRAVAKFVQTELAIRVVHTTII